MRTTQTMNREVGSMLGAGYSVLVSKDEVGAGRKSENKTNHQGGPGGVQDRINHCCRSCC